MDLWLILAQVLGKMGSILGITPKGTNTTQQDPHLTGKPESYIIITYGCLDVSRDDEVDEHDIEWCFEWICG
jgi:hypothetical protein